LVHCHCGQGEDLVENDLSAHDVLSECGFLNG
jgi:hypothetical protein